MKVDIDKVKGIVEHYGEAAQQLKAIEELSELQTCVIQRLGDKNKVSDMDIIGEIADVYIVLKELELIYALDDREIQPMIEYKLYRTGERMKAESGETDE